MSTTAVLVEAKKELTKHIINRLVPFFYEEFRLGFQSLCVVDSIRKVPHIYIVMRIDGNDILMDRSGQFDQFIFSALRLFRTRHN